MTMKQLKKYSDLLLLSCILAFSSSFKINPPCDGEKLLSNCASGLDDFVFIKSFTVTSEKEEQKTEYSYVLSRGISYRLVICEQDNAKKSMVVNLYDRNKKLIASNYLKSGKKIFPIVNYTCAATGVYYVEAYFEGEKKGCGLNILGFKK